MSGAAGAASGAPPTAGGVGDMKRDKLGGVGAGWRRSPPPRSGPPPAGGAVGDCIRYRVGGAVGLSRRNMPVGAAGILGGGAGAGAVADLTSSLGGGRFRPRGDDAGLLVDVFSTVLSGAGGTDEPPRIVGVMVRTKSTKISPTSRSGCVLLDRTGKLAPAVDLGDVGCDTPLRGVTLGCAANGAESAVGVKDRMRSPRISPGSLPASRPVEEKPVWIAWGAVPLAGDVALASRCGITLGVSGVTGVAGSLS